MKISFVLPLVLMTSIFFGGCQNWTGDPIVEIIGEVTIDNHVLTDAFVVFVPRQFRAEDGSINPMGFGKTDKTGRFEIMAGEQKGVLLGQYRVLIFRADSGSGTETDAAMSNKNDGLESMALPSLPFSLSPLQAQIPQALRERKTDVPTKYNLETELEYAVDMPLGIVYPKFNLSSR